MILVTERARRPLADEMLRSRCEARKRLFVDLLKWDEPVLEDRFEIDQFDNEHAIYLVVRGEDGEHLASARLLPTVRPHLLDTLFVELCASHPPRGPGVLEITRFCLDRRVRGLRRLAVRNRLVSALADYALANGIVTYTGVAEMAWLQQILAFGWRCRPLGLPRTRNGKMLGALRIDISAETPALLARNGLYTPGALGATDARQAA